MNRRGGATVSTSPSVSAHAVSAATVMVKVGHYLPFLSLSLFHCVFVVVADRE